MDPHIYAGESGSSVDANKVDEPVNYLRRLKSDVSGTSTAPAAATSRNSTKGPAATAAAAGPAFKERRQTVRMRCSGSVELRADGGDVRIWGTLTDISLHGCYVEMNTTFRVDTPVHLVLKSFGVRIETPGTVRATYPFLGMGILFANTKPAELRQLEQLCSTLAGRNAIPAPTTAANDPQKALASADSKALLDEIVGFFQKKPSLSRDEFYAIASRVRRC